MDKFANTVLLIEDENFSINYQVKYTLEDDINCLIDIVITNKMDIILRGVSMTKVAVAKVGSFDYNYEDVEKGMNGALALLGGIEKYNY